jgi:hypothetical protein
VLTLVLTIVVMWLLDAPPWAAVLAIAVLASVPSEGERG